MIKTLLVMLLAVGLNGCAALGMLVGGKYQTYTGADSVDLPSQRADILNAVSETGQSMGLSVSGMDKKAGTISLQNSSSMASTMLMGKSNQVHLGVTVTNNGKTLDLEITIVGNFGSGTREAADKILEDFKSRLHERLAQ